MHALEAVSACLLGIWRERRRLPGWLWRGMERPRRNRTALAWAGSGFLCPASRSCQYIFLGRSVEGQLSKNEAGAPMARLGVSCMAVLPRMEHL